jgi:hypothetical protein
MPLYNNEPLPQDKNGNVLQPSAFIQLPVLAQASLTVTTSSQGLSAATLKTGGTGIPTDARYARINLSGGSAYITLSGAATSSDEAVTAGTTIELFSADDINNFRLLLKDGAPKLTITYRG